MMARFTADDARKGDDSDLDERIKRAVKACDAGPTASYLRIYVEDPWASRIEQELLDRGFKNIQVPSIVLKGDVYFEWGEE
jgi:hypothetical protein